MVLSEETGRNIRTAPRTHLRRLITCPGALMACRVVGSETGDGVVIGPDSWGQLDLCSYLVLGACPTSGLSGLEGCGLRQVGGAEAVVHALVGVHSEHRAAVNGDAVSVATDEHKALTGIGQREEVSDF